MKFTFTSPNGEEYEIEGPEGSSREQAFNVLQEGIKAGYYKPKTKGKVVIPGQEGEEERVAKLQAQPAAQGGEALGVVEAALSTATGLFSGIQAPVAGLLSSAFGMVPDAEQETARLMEQQTYRPRTEKGQDYAEGVGKVINDVLAPLGPGNLTGLALARPIPGLLRKEKVPVQPMAPDRTAILKGVEVDEPTTPYTKTAPEAAADDALVARLEAAINKQNPKQGEIRVGKDGEAYFTSPETEYARKQAEQRMLQENEAAYADPFNRMSRELAPDEVQPAPTPIDPFEQIRAQALAAGDQQRYQQAQAAIEARQKQLEFETARQTLLDQQAADRTRQGQAPTGAAADVARLRETQNRRLPGDNTPLEMDSPYPVDINQFPQVMRDAPYQYEGGLPFDQPMLDKSLPVEVADMLGKTPEPDPFNRYSPNQAARRILIEGEKPPIKKTQDARVNKTTSVKEAIGDVLDAIHTELGGKKQFIGEEGKLKEALTNLARVLFDAGERSFTNVSTKLKDVFGNIWESIKDVFKTIWENSQGVTQGVINAGLNVKAKFTGKVPPKPDTIATPRSAATIAAKQEKAAKAAAIGLTDSVYSAPTTIEEVLANPGKDISTPLQDLAPGQYSVIRKNAKNNVLKFTNRLFTQARLTKIKDSVALITGKGAYNDLLKKLTPEEKMLVAQDAMFLDKNGAIWNDAKAEQLGYSPAMKAFMDWRMKAHETVANKADAVLAEQGLKPLNRRQSYAPSNFDTAYTALVTKVGKDGKLKVVVPLNANSLWEYKKAMAWAKEKFSGAEYSIQELPRRGLNTEATKTYRGIQKEGLARLLEEMAKLDPNMQAAKAELDAWIEGQTKKLYGHDVHLLRKQGLEGSIGDRPWLDAKRNAEDFFAQEVNHIEEALQYWNYQKPVNETRQLVANPKIGQMKNTVKYLDRYLQHIAGQGLNPLGAALNWTVDKIFAAAGKGSGKSINAATSATREIATIWMMGVYNPTFMNVQLSQTATGMVPEIIRIRNEFGLSPETIATSFGNSTFGLTMIGAADALGKLDNVEVAPHLVDAYKWMKEHGLTRYNEVEQSHEATQNPKWHQTKQWLSLPITIPEKITTPQAFMWAVDMMYQGGKRGDDLYLSAYNSAKYAMTEYHPDEAPMVYQRLGVVGQHVGGLKKFVHNAVDQQASRSMELAKNPAAFGAMLGMTFLTMGAMGLAGVGMLDKLSLSLTDKGLRDHYDELFGTSKGAQGMRDGFASVLTGFDLQTRYSMADLVPGSFTEAVIGPHLSKLGKMGISLVEYGMNPSEQSFREMAKQTVPSGLAGTLEENYLLGPQGQVLDKEGQNKYPKNLGKNPDGTDNRFWRTEGEHAMRAWGGPRPLRERLYDEQKYQADVVQRKKDEKRNDAGKAMVVAIGYGDDKGFQAAMKKFIENEGDISTLDQRIQTYMDNKGLSSKQRAAGNPGDSITSIKKFQRYQEKP